MNAERTHASDIAFTPTVKALQSLHGSRAAYAHMEDGAGWPEQITEELANFIGTQTSMFLATANAEGQPYIQHRGGPPGFLHVIDEKTIAFADFAGNRQYITTGNLSENVRAHMFLIDYAQQLRIKIWGEAHVVEDDAEFLTKLQPQNYKARSERAIVFTVKAWDANCKQHIPQRFDASDVAAALEERDQRIQALEAEVERLQKGLGSSGH